MTAQFQEIGRIKVNDTTDIVVSMVKNDDSEIVGINVNHYITTPRYTGFTKATFIPNDKIAELHRLIGNIL